MFDWIEDHFSLTTWPAVFDTHGEFSLFRIDFDWQAGGYYAAQVALFGLNASLSYWPNGKWDELPDDFADLMANSSVVLPYADFEALKADADKWRESQR